MACNCSYYIKYFVLVLMRHQMVSQFAVYRTCKVNVEQYKADASSHATGDNRWTTSNKQLLIRVHNTADWLTSPYQRAMITTATPLPVSAVETSSLRQCRALYQRWTTNLLFICGCTGKQPSNYHWKEILSTFARNHDKVGVWDRRSDL